MACGDGKRRLVVGGGVGGSMKVGFWVWFLLFFRWMELGFWGGRGIAGGEGGGWREVGL